MFGQGLAIYYLRYNFTSFLPTGQAMAIRVRLRVLLEKRGMAQTELQARTGLGYSTINALYHGKTERVEFATLDKLCEVLSCEVGEILERVSEDRRARSK
jgi:putative transcriptional regulator